MFKNILKKTFLFGMLMTFLASTNGIAQDLKAKLPIDPKVTTGKLSNGLTYYIRPNAKPENKVELRLVVNAGSILEDENQQGLAHFMEHMNFNGTKNFPKNKLVDYLQSIGVEFGADLNAYTSFDETVYILPIPTDKEGNLENGFQVIEDWAHQALLTDKEIDSERGIVLEESRLGKGAEDRMMKKYLGAYLNNSHYAKRLPIGKDNILKTFKYDVLRKFYKDWYRPNLMAVIVVGDISTAKAEEMIKKHFGAMKNPTNERIRKSFEVNPYAKQTAMVVTDKEAASYEFTLNYPAVKVEKQVTIGDYRQEMVKNIFISLLNKRLSDLREGATPPFTYAYAYVGGFARGYENFSVTAIPNSDIKTSIDATIAELLKAQKFGFNASELELQKKAMMNSMEKLHNEKDKQKSSNYASEYIRAFLTHEPIPGTDNEFEYYKEFIPGITLEEVNKEAKTWLDNNKNYFTLVTGNGKDLKVSSQEELLKTVQASFQQKVTANEVKEIASQLLDKEPIAGKITGEVKDKDLGSTTYTLSNGLKVTIKKTDFKNDEILFSGIKKGGTNSYGAEDKSNTQLGLSFLGSMGYGNFTPNQLKDFLAGKTVNVSASMGAISNNVKGNSSIKDLETLLQLNYLKLTEPRKDADLLNGVIKSSKAQLTFMANNPQMAFINGMLKDLYNNSPLAPLAVPTEEDFDKIDLDRTLAIYKKEFSDATGFEFFFVGNIDEATIKPLIEKYIASLPVTAGEVPNYKDNGLRAKKGVNQFKFYKGSDDKSLILSNYFGTIPYSEDLEMKADMMAEIINIKITEIIREKMSAIYGGGMSATVIDKPYNHYQIMAQLPCGSENVDKVLKAMDDIIKDIKTKGPDAADLEKVKMAKYEKHKDAVKENNYWLGKLQSLIFWGDSKDRFLNFDKNVESVSAKDIQETAQKLFDGKNIYNAIMYPEKVKK
ncbi:MAG TPA: insulinase family protein [Edaphocola sp.]|nr:insulinase family protein [Edaphocola sp.]